MGNASYWRGQKPQDLMTNWLCVVKKYKGVKLTSNICTCNAMIRTTAGRVSFLQEEEMALVWAMLIIRCW